MQVLSERLKDILISVQAINKSGEIVTIPAKEILSIRWWPIR